jgi:hypothetical protein
MQLRTLLTAASALAATAALVLVPAAQASNPTGEDVGSVRVSANTTGSYPVTMAIPSGSSITMEIFGAPTELFCRPGVAAAGTVHAGSPAPTSPFMNLDDVDMMCDGWGEDDTYWTIPTTGCALLGVDDANVHDGVVDTGPAGGKFSAVDGFFGPLGLQPDRGQRSLAPSPSVASPRPTSKRAPRRAPGSRRETHP